MWCLHILVVIARVVHSSWYLYSRIWYSVKVHTPLVVAEYILTVIVMLVKHCNPIYVLVHLLKDLVLTWGSLYMGITCGTYMYQTMMG